MLGEVSLISLFFNIVKLIFYVISFKYIFCELMTIFYIWLAANSLVMLLCLFHLQWPHEIEVLKVLVLRFWMQNTGADHSYFLFLKKVFKFMVYIGFLFYDIYTWGHKQVDLLVFFWKEVFEGVCITVFFGEENFIHISFCLLVFCHLVWILMSCFYFWTCWIQTKHIILLIVHYKYVVVWLRVLFFLAY